MRYLKLILATFTLLVNVYQLTAQITYLNAINSNNKDVNQMVVSPDNRFAYATARGEIQTYQKNTISGQLTHLSSLTQMTDGTLLEFLAPITMSPDGRYVYALSTLNAFIFSRDSLTGTLTPFQTLSDGSFIQVHPSTSNNIMVSNNGKHIYIAGRDDLYIYERNSATDILSLIDTMQNLNSIPYTSFEISVLLSFDNQLAFVTGGRSVSVYSRDTTIGKLTFKSIISGNNFDNTGLTYSRQSVISSDDRFLYTVSNSQGSGALVVLEKDPVSDSLYIIQTLENNIRPQYIDISYDNKLICISSGPTTVGAGSLIFYSRDSLSGKLKYPSKYIGSLKYHANKHIDSENRYFYTCPHFTDSIYIHRFDLILESSVYFCEEDSIVLKPWANFVTYLWSTGSTNPSITVNNPGTYYLTVTDSSGNIFSDSIIVDNHPSQSIVNSIKDTTLYVWQTIYLSAGYNNSYWKWIIDNDTLPYLYLVNDSTFFGSKMIIVTATDYYGCTLSDTVYVTFSPDYVSINSIKQNVSKLHFYPNPCSKQTTMQTEDILYDATLSFFNIYGQNVKQIENLSGQSVTLQRDNLLNGVYFVRLTQENKTVALGKLIITD